MDSSEEKPTELNPTKLGRLSTHGQLTGLERPEEVIADELLELPPEERSAYLARVCANDSRLRQMVEALLCAEKVGLADRPAGSAHRPSEKLGQRIGNYKLLQEIGEGGFGVVYMAEQEQPVRRRVALKIIKLGMDTRQVVARFEAERQALALMDHPNIAKVLDAGATETGRPYFVMELVRGIKLTEYCDRNNLPTRSRLDLFIQICRAIQHAHQKGIIHRDIKPSNILVTLHDGVPVPKIIDFGIAKAISGQTLTDKTLFTAYEQFIGTPAYMSPEQAELSGLDIDTRSDIYSLGVLLYELLTGNTPFDFVKAGLDEIRRIIREEEPPRPSTRLSALDASEQTTVAKRRRAEPPKLVHIVRGDLDWIVMKCLEKDRTRRYETVNGLATDLRRHLDNEPVLARPPSKLYRFQKIIRRNKLAFAAVTAVALSLLVGFAISTWLLVREQKAQAQASKEARRSQQIAQLLEEALNGIAPQAARGGDTTLLKALMEQTQKRMENELQGQPDLQAELYNTIGRVYRLLGDFQTAERMHRKALELQEKAQLRRADMTVTLMHLALDLQDQGGQVNLDAAEKLQREVLQLRLDALGNSHTNVAIAMEHLAAILRRQHKLSEAEELNRQALAMLQKLLGNDHPSIARSLNNLATTLRDQRKFVEAENFFRDAARMLEKLLGGKENPEVAIALDNLAYTFLLDRKLADAEPIQREALRLLERFEGEHPDVANSLEHLARLLQSRAAANLAPPDSRAAWLGEAEQRARQAIAMRGKLRQEETREMAASYYYLGGILRDQGRLADAENAFQTALNLGKRFSEPAIVAEFFRSLHQVLHRQNKDDAVERLTREMLIEPATDPRQQAALLRALGNIRARDDQWREAADHFRHALELEPDNPEAYHALTALLSRTNDPNEYANVCALALNRFGQASPAIRERIAWDCLIVPAPGIDLAAVARLADSAAMTTNGTKAGSAHLLTKGLAQYRQGNFAAAVQSLEQMLAGQADGSLVKIEALFILSMARQTSNQSAAARTAFTKAKALAGKFRGEWDEVSVAQALRDEAANLLQDTSLPRKENSQ